MEIGNLINCMCIACALICSTVAHDYWKTQGKDDPVRWVVIILGFFAFFSNLCSGFFGFATSHSAAHAFHILAIFGGCSFIVVEYYLFCKILYFSKKRTYITSLIFIGFAVFDFIYYGHASIFHYIKSGVRTAVKIDMSLPFIFHTAFFIATLLTYAFISFKYGTKLKLKRERNLIFNFLIANCIMLVFTYPGTIHAATGSRSIPTSGVGIMLCYLVICYYSSSNNAYNITVSNLGSEIFDATTMGILIFDTHLELTHFNAYSRWTMGVNFHRGMKSEDIFRYSNEDFKELYNKATVENRLRVKVKSFDGNRTLSINPSVIKDFHGDPFCLIVAVYDMTHEEKMMQDVIEADTAKSRFLANMSHEIRTPINAILGMNEMIMRESEDNHILNYSKDIDSASHSLLSIVNDILDFSKIESGNLEIIPVNYDIQSLINDCYNMISIRAKAKNLEFKVITDPNLPLNYSGDVIRIRQIIINLLTNAVKYTKTGSVTMKVGFEPYDQGFINLIVSVIDTGMGIKKESFDDLFSSFKRIEEKKNRNIEGTGLGLAITKQLVDLMHGTIEVESEYGHGSTFTVSVPQRFIGAKTLGETGDKFVESAGKTATSSEPVKKAAGPTFTAPNANILVVDDVEMNLKVFKALLKKTKINIDAVTSGKACLELIKEKQYHIIFMDHMMPEMDGIETFQAMKASSDHKNVDTPVIMLTANAIVGASEEYMNEGFTDYISKPIKPQKLEEMLMQYLSTDLVIKSE